MKKKYFFFEEGDLIKIIHNRTNENVTFCKFHLNANLEEDGMKTENLTGILNLCLLKYIASKIDNLNVIKFKDIRNIISELKEEVNFNNDPLKDIQANLTQNNGNNIISYINYIDSLISEEQINYLIKTFDQSNQKEIKKFWSILSKYQTFNEKFEEGFLKEIEKSYFDYSLIGVSIYQQKK